MDVEIRLESVRHDYARTSGGATVHALRELDLQIPEGAFVVLMGPSGSGKSTLLNILGGVERPTAGKVLFGRKDIASLNETELTLLRRESIGYIFQFFNLLPTLSVEENVGFPLALAGVARNAIRERTAQVLAEVSLSHRATHSPAELSGGEMQRVAIARAIVHEPRLLLADEPTGNLDSRTGDQILELIRTLHERHRPTIVMATHSDHAASYGDYIIRLADGQVVE